MIKILKNNLIFFFVLIFYFLYLCCAARSLPINSDIANHMLQAQDFLSGNFLMKGWIFTGVTFLTTDLFVYEIAEILCNSINWKSFYLSSALMVFFVVLTFFWLIFKNNKKNITKIVIFILLSTVFNYYCFFYLRVHTVAISYTFIVFLLFYNILQENNKISESYVKQKDNKKNVYIFLFMLFIFLGAFGDFLFVVECVYPLLLFLSFYILQGKEKIISKLKIFVAVVINIILVFLADKIYFILNKSDRNSYISDKNFTEIDKICDSFIIFFKNLFFLTSGNYWETNIGNFFTYIKFINIFILLIGVVILFYILFKFFSLKEVDDISALLSLSVLFVFLANIFTPLNQARYITIIPFALYGLIIRNFDDISNLFKNKNCFCVVFIVLCLFSFIDKFNSINYKKFDESTERMKDISNFLIAKKLTYGFSSFWQSSIFTVLSEDKVKIRHIECIGNNFYQQNWFCKDLWYNEDTHFILFDLNGNDCLDQDKVKKYFGLPNNIYEYNNYIIYVYDKNISPLVIDNHNYLPKLFILPLERFYFNKNVVKDVKTHKLMLSKEGLVFGPYLYLGEGKYEVIIYGKNLLSVYCDVYSNFLKLKSNVNYIVNNISDSKICLLLDFKDIKRNKICDIEFRLFNNGDSMVEFDHVEVKSYGK